MNDSPARKIHELEGNLRKTMDAFNKVKAELDQLAQKHQDLERRVRKVEGHVDPFAGSS